VAVEACGNLGVGKHLISVSLPSWAALGCLRPWKMHDKPCRNAALCGRP